MNQFFTESQFESYRRLGLHIVETAFENVDTVNMTAAPVPGTNLPAYVPPKDVFQNLAAVWYPGSNPAPDVWARLADSYSALMKELVDDRDLAFLDAELVHGTTDQVGIPNEMAERKASYFTRNLLLFVWTVWSELGLDSEDNRTNPMNAGWMTIFRKWKKAPSVVKSWKTSRDNYSSLFRRFFDEL
jgi:hypothetical protein